MKKNLPQRLKMGVLLLLLLIGSFAFGQTTVTYNFSDSGAVTGLNEASPGITLDANIGFGSFKNDGTSAPIINSGQLRLYQNATKGGSIRIYPSNGVTITKVVVYASGGGTGPAGYNVDSGAETNISISGGAYTMSDLTATSRVEFYSKGTSSSTRVYVDSFAVTYTTSGGNTGPDISNISQNPISSNVTSSDAVTVSADIIDSDGVDQTSVKLHWGTDSGSLGTTITMTSGGGASYSAVIPAQADGTTVYYKIEATDTNGTPLTTTSPQRSYTVTDPPVFGIPYDNGFRNGTDFTEAVDFEFLFANAAMSGSYLKIDGGSMTTPAIDFSAYGEITVSFATETWGGSRGQELSVLVSNDNGASYTNLGSYPTPANYRTDTQVIDLSSLNGAEGRIKFEMTAGTESIRFRDLVISGVAAFDGYVFNGTWSPEDPSGIATASDNIRVLSGIASLTENTTANNITINTGATLNIEKVLTIAGDITINGDLVFVSSATGNGELAAVPSTSTITGQATVQSYMSNNRSYRMVSSSVTTSGSIHDNWQEGAISNIDNPNPGFGTHITGSRTDQHNGFDGTVTGNPSMFFVPFGSQQFQAIANTNQTNLNAGDPYLLFVRGDRSIDLGDNYSSSETTLRAKGTLHTGPTQQDFETADEGQFIMFGNPYQSAVDINSVLENNFWFNTNFYHVYDPNIATHGGYVTVNLPDGTNTDDSDANQYLQPGQGGQFVVTVPGAALISVIFDESDKAPGNFTATSAMGNRLSSDNMLTVQLFTTENFNNGGPTHDSFGIIFGDGFDNEVTHTDALKPMNFYENLGRDHNGTYLSIERREMPGDAEVYPFYSSGYNYTDYTLKMKIDGLDDNIFYLDDHFTQTSTLLDGRETTYNFTVDKNDPLSIDTGRFAVRTEARLDVNDNNMLAGIRLYPNPLNDNTFYINAPNLNGKQLDVNINDLSGRVIYKAALDCQNNMVVVPMKMDIASGIYLVTLNHGGESHTIRLIKE